MLRGAIWGAIFSGIAVVISETTSASWFFSLIAAFVLSMVLEWLAQKWRSRK